MADQYSLKHHVMMMIMIMIAIRKATMVSTKLQKANKKKTLKKISPNIAEFRRINKYQPNNNYFIFFISMVPQSLVSQGFTITLRHTTLGRTPMDE